MKELLWLHGKNAPLEEDFLHSALHDYVREVWPDCAIFTDEWL